MSTDVNLVPFYTPTFTNSSEYKVPDEKQLRFMFDNWEALLRQPCLQPAAGQNSDGIPFNHGMKDIFDVAILLPEAEIGRTNLIARIGPGDPDEMARLLDERIFPTDKKATADAIVRLGKAKEDFVDYTEDKKAIYTSVTGKRYRINHCLPVKHDWPKHRTPLFYDNHVSIILENSDSCPCCFCCDMEEENSLRVVTFPIEDGTSICLESEEEQKQFSNFIFELIQSISNQSKIVIHCKAGVGRTGHLIYTILLVQKLSQLVIPGNIEATANNFRVLLNEIRYYRYGAVFSYDQFLASLNNAALVLRCHYRKQLDAPVVMAEIPRAIGAPSLIPQSQSQSTSLQSFIVSAEDAKSKVRVAYN